MRERTREPGAWRRSLRQPPEAAAGAMAPPNRPIRVLVADEQPVVREGLSAMIGGQLDMTVVGEAANGPQTLAAFRRLRPDVTLMDLRLPGLGVDVTIRLVGESPGARVLVFTAGSGDEEVYQALRARARGYLLKNADRAELVEAIRAIHAGERRLAGVAASRLAERLPGSDLTGRERDVLRFMVDGHNNRDIARSLGLTHGTVKGYVHNVLGKLGAADRTQAVAFALRRGFVQTDSTTASPTPG
jgi:two-component system, NarL family, response regulator